ncbi:Glucose-6-phosphate isomerase [bacterium HR11]|nr:Glucose-6-phosphate isomerase [bacterium HR11]
MRFPKGLTGNLGPYETRVVERLRSWQAADFVRRLRGRDPTLWFPGPVPEITDRLGWLELPVRMRPFREDLRAFAEAVRAEGTRHVVLLGMGGSSLASEVFQHTFGNAPGHPELIVLDSTHPAAVGAVEARLALARTLFLVSSKSGTTTETLALFRYFWHRVRSETASPGRHFVAITDPGTPLEQTARARGFRHVFLGPPDVGGRYSALSVFGLLPAALIGVDVDELLDRAQAMAAACLAEGSEPENPGLVLGAVLGELARAGRDKVTFLTSPLLRAFPTWLEQLIAESTGKGGRGIVPVVDEPPGAPEAYGPDRFFVYLSLEGERDADSERRVATLEAAGHPVLRIHLDGLADLGGEFFRWEVAVAAACAVLGVHPFDQPDVQRTKELTQRAVERPTASPIGVPAVSEPTAWDEALRDWSSQARPGDYIALQAFLAPTPETTAVLQDIRRRLRDRLRVATTLGYGPRFLHSTGQLHKGGPNAGLFLQLIDDPAEDRPIPETDLTFGRLLRAQADGDYQALVERGRRILRLHLGRDVLRGLEVLRDALA